MTTEKMAVPKDPEKSDLAVTLCGALTNSVQQYEAESKEEAIQAGDAALRDGLAKWGDLPPYGEDGGAREATNAIMSQLRDCLTLMTMNDELGGSCIC